MKAISTMLWRTYSDLHEHTLADEGLELPPEQREIFNRCVLFLLTDLEYQWAEDNFIGFRLLGFLERVFTFGLSTRLATCLHGREERRLIALHVIGEEAIWPFLTANEYRLHQSR